MPTLQQRQLLVLGGNNPPPDVPVPTYGAELLTNGDMETGSPPSSWTAEATATLSATTAYAGAQALRVQRGSSSIAATQTITPAIGTWLYLVGRVKKGTSTSGRMALTIGVAGMETPVTTSGNWDELRLTGRNRTGSTKTVDLIVIGSSGQYSDYDNVSLVPINLASMFSTRAYTTHNTTKAKVTLAASGTRAGVVSNLDSAATPANFVYASHDGSTAQLVKCVAGSYTVVITATTTYVAGSYVEIRRTAGTNTWQLFYNGSQVGTDQTISDAGIINNTLAGYFNTYAGNTFSDFSCVAS